MSSMGSLAQLEAHDGEPQEEHAAWRLAVKVHKQGHMTTGHRVET